MSEENGCGSVLAGIGIPFLGESYPGVYPVASPSGDVGTINPARSASYVAGNYLANGRDYRVIGADEVNSVVKVLSHVTHRAMMTDPAIRPAFETLRFATLAGTLKITPATHGKKKKEGDAPNPDAELAKEIAEFCSRAVNRLDEHISIILAEFFDAVAYRNKVGERVEELISEGPDAGKWSLKSVPRIPHWSYNFRVDSRSRLTHLRCITDDGQGGIAWKDVPRDHFVIAQWAAREGSPVGESILDTGYETWVWKRNLIPNYWKGLRQFGSPSMFGTTPEDAEGTIQRDSAGNPMVDEDGNELPPENPQIGMRNSLQAFFESGTIIVGPAGSEIKVIESNRDAAGIAAAIDRCDRDLTKIVLLQIRATLESKFGSKADSQTGQDILGVFVQFLRTWICSIVDRDLLFPIVQVNWGTEVANRLTPNTSLGRISPEDLVKASNALAALFQSGYLTEEQLPETDAMIDLPIREPGAKRVGPQQDPEQNQNSGADGQGQPTQDASGQNPPNQNPNGQNQAA